MAAGEVPGNSGEHKYQETAATWMLVNWRRDEKMPRR
jgi:hypothetical protein